MRAPVVALWGLLGCSSAPETVPSTPPAPAPEPAVRSSEPEQVLTSLTEALSAAGHTCQPTDEDVPVCDKGVTGRASFAVVYGAPLAFFVSNFRLISERRCADLLGLLNELNAKADGIKVTCLDGDLSFVTSFLVPECGLSRTEIAGHAQRFQGLIQLMLGNGGLAPHLR